jgi:acetyl-CoA carboxylase alpha subunit
VPELAAVLGSILRLHTSVAVAPTQPERRPGPVPEPPARGPAWHSVTTTRQPGRPGTRDLLARAGDDTVLLSGTGSGGLGGGMILALTRLSGTACVVVGHDRGHPNGAAVGPDGLRVARRGIALARELALPLVTVIDTPGAELSPEAEANALAGEIARCLGDLAVLTVPSVALLMGQGCGGAALALLPAATVVAAQHAWLSPLPPEGASVIVHGDVEHAPALTDAQGVASAVLWSNGIVDVVVPEHPAAHEDPSGFCRRMAVAAVAALAAQVTVDRKVS